MNKLVQITPKDMVAVALQALTAGETVDYGAGRVTLKGDIPMGHKVALRDIIKGEPVIKYGFPIGSATEDIPAGGHVHVHNIHTLLSGTLEYEYHPSHPALAQKTPVTFPGYPRKLGRPGIRNELWIIPTVGCVNDIAQALAKDAQRFVGGSVEGVYAFPHPYGCSQMGGDQDNTRQILANLCTHPNAGGVLLLGLGCENSGIDQVIPHMGQYDPDRFRTLITQQVEDEHEAAMALIRELIENMRKDVRVPCPAGELVVGLKCGGSDGLSGITANPTIGVFSDILTSMGGSTILTEVPEMFGAETILMDRCADAALFDKTVHLINDFKEYFESYHMPVYENPSPGNKAGGITTLEDKSLGCVQKGGSAPVEDVLGYGEAVRRRGLTLVTGPGNDLVASTVLAAAGAHLILFTTGRGTPFGCVVPTLKIASNDALAAAKPNWIDWNAMSAPDVEAFARKVVAVASGEPAKNELAGDRGIAIFKDGVTL